MNATNRAVNRIVLCVVGAVLLAVGGAALAAVAWPPGAKLWKSGLSTAQTWIADTAANTRLHESTTVSWLTVAALALLLAVVVLAVVIISRLGGGRSSTVTRAEAGDGAVGAVTIAHGFAADALTHSLASHDDILSSRVSSGRVRGEDVLHVSVTPRQNTSPVDVAATVTTLVDNLERLTGRETPTFVSIHSGVRSRLAADRSRVQ